MGAPSANNIPAPLLDVVQPSEPEPRESDVAEAPLPDRADPVAEHRSSCSKRSSRPLDVERASLFRASAGSSCFGNREKTTQSGLSAQNGARHTEWGSAHCQGSVYTEGLSIPSGLCIKREALCTVRA